MGGNSDDIPASVCGVVDASDVGHLVRRGRGRKRRSYDRVRATPRKRLWRAVVKDAKD